MPWLLYPAFGCVHTSRWPLRCGTTRKLRAIHTCTHAKVTPNLQVVHAIRINRGDLPFGIASAVPPAQHSPIASDACEQWMWTEQLTCFFNFRCTYKHSSIDFYQLCWCVSLLPAQYCVCYTLNTRCDFENFIFTADSFSNESHFEWTTFITFAHENGIPKKRRNVNISPRVEAHWRISWWLWRWWWWWWWAVQRVIDIGERLCRCPEQGNVSNFTFFATSKRIKIKECKLQSVVIDFENTVPGTDELPSVRDWDVPSVPGTFHGVNHIKYPVWLIYSFFVVAF